FSGEADNRQLLAPRRVDCPQNVRRTAGRRDCDENISWAAEPTDLPFENLVVAIVVANRSENRGIGRQSQCGRRRPIIIKPRQELASYMLCIPSASTIAGEEQLVPPGKRARNDIYDILNRRREGGIIDRGLDRVAGADQEVEDRVHSRARNFLTDMTAAPARGLC